MILKYELRGKKMCFRKCLGTIRKWNKKKIEENKFRENSNENIQKIGWAKERDNNMRKEYGDSYQGSWTDYV